MSLSNGRRIVLTGGPGGGKTTAADLFRRELGEGVVIVPEAATLLFSGGFPRSDEINARRSLQSAIYHVQTNLEDVQSAMYPNRILLCDRGTVDGGAYWPRGCEDFCQNMGTTLALEFSRYDAVVFFESAAVGGIPVMEGGNPTRREDVTQALEVDTQLRTIWSQHPNFIHIPHEDSFLKKVMNGLDALLDIAALKSQPS